MSFRFELLRATIYQIIPLNQRSDFHVRAYNHLRLQNTKCPECLNYELTMAMRRQNPFFYDSNWSVLSQESDRSARNAQGRTEARRGAVLGNVKMDSSSEENFDTASVHTGITNTVGNKLFCSC